MINKTTYGYTVEKDNTFLDVVFFSDNIVRFAYNRDKKLPETTVAVVGKPKQVEVELQNNIIETKSLKIVIDDNNLHVTIYDKDGNIISKDLNVDTNKPEIKKALLWEKGFYGLGEKYSWINHKGSSSENWNTDMLAVAPLHNPTLKTYHTSIPFYIGLDSDRCYGIYFDNTFRNYFDFGKEEEEVVSFKATGGILDYYFIYDNSISEVIKGYSHITGRTPLPRKEFLGYQQCRWSYENRDELMSVAHKMRENNIPCDILYLDIDYMKDYKVFTVDDEKFYDFKEMVKTLKDMGFKLVVIIDPGVKEEKGYSVYDEGINKDYFIKNNDGKVYVGQVWPGDSVFPDFLREDVRTWWGELHKDLIEDGVEGIWNDMNEPADASTESKTLPEDSIHKDDDGEERIHSEIHNLYGMLEAMATYNGLKNIAPNKRPFVLTRAASAGTQRYSALWTGDNHSIWEHMESGIPMLLNLGLSGYPFVGGDVGGFAGDSNGELLSRWTQTGAFTPFFRNHSAKGTINQEPWVFGDETLKNTRKYIKLRYSLITYLYNLMKNSSMDGSPVIRPLFYHYQDDEVTYNINDQFLFGENIMVCPISRPKVEARMVYLPKGIWYDYWTDERIEGGKYIVRKTPIDIIPIYIKAGSIIPMDEVKDYIDNKTENLDLHIYPGSDGEYRLYLDDGVSFDYISGVYSEINFKLIEGEELTLEGKIIKKEYDLPKFKVKIHGINNKKINIDAKELNILLV